MAGVLKLPIILNILINQKSKISNKFEEGGKMTKKKKGGPCLGRKGMGSHAKATSECKVESIVTIDERGQMVLPKEIREKAGIKAGDKLAVLNWEKAGRVCCISLIRVEDFAKMVKEHLGPMMKEIAPE